MRSFDELVEFFSQDKFATENNMKIESVEEGNAVCSVELTHRHYNAVGGVQGGVVFTLADFAFAVAANCAERMVVSVSSNISFIHGTRGTKLFAHAIEKKSTRKLCFYDVEVKDDLGELISTVSITGYVKQ